jgi:hypothetical protein
MLSRLRLHDIAGQMASLRKNQVIVCGKERPRENGFHALP